MILTAHSHRIVIEPEETYRAHPALSQSELKKYLSSPKLAKFEKDFPQPPSDDMIEGSRMHLLLSHPTVFAEKYVQLPDVHPVLGKIHKAKTDWKVFIEKFQAENAGKEFIDAESWDRIIGMHASLVADSSFRMALDASHGNLEVSCYFTLKTEFGEFECKARCDGYTARSVWDAKTTRHSAKDFDYSIKDYGYAFQGAFYLLAFERPNFILFGVQRKRPHEVIVRPLTNVEIENAKTEIWTALSMWQQCQNSGYWPSLSESKGVTVEDLI